MGLNYRPRFSKITIETCKTLCGPSPIKTATIWSPRHPCSLTAFADRQRANWVFSASTSRAQRRPHQPNPGNIDGIVMGDGADCLPHSGNVWIFVQRHKSLSIEHDGARRPRIKSGRIFRRCRRHVWRDEMEKETTRTAIPLLGQLAHVHLESNPLQLGRNYQLDCRLLLPIRHWWTRSWSWNSSLRFVSSSCQQKLHLINDLSILSHLGLIWAVIYLDWGPWASWAGKKKINPPKPKL